MNNEADDAPLVIPRDQHCISRKQISPRALKVLYGLHEAGFKAHLVGGGVRDLLIGRTPKDFDVATDASPEQVRATFRNCRLIGRRFRLAHVYFGREIIEVATFRAPHDDSENAETSKQGRLLRDNIYGNRSEDARRRDFTINALYYDIADFSVLDYVGGYQDLHKGVIRMIGEPVARYREDPVRLLRAIRFAAKLDFVIDPETAAPIAQVAPLLRDVPSARLFDESVKLLLCEHALSSYQQLGKFDLLRYLLATPASPKPEAARLVELGLTNTEQRLREDKTVTPAFLYAVLLWPLYCQLRQGNGHASNDHQRDWQAQEDAIGKQLALTGLPKRFSIALREIWSLQRWFERRRGQRPLRLLQHPRFRAAYDFLLLRAAAGEPVAELAEWWTTLQQAGPDQRRTMTLPGRGKRKKPVDHKSRQGRSGRIAAETTVTSGAGSP